MQAVFADFGMWYYCAYYSTRPAVAKLQRLGVSSDLLIKTTLCILLDYIYITYSYLRWCLGIFYGRDNRDSRGLCNGLG